MNYQNPKGTRDFFPADMEARRIVFDRLRAVALRYNFGEIESPAIETMKLLTAKSGESIKKEIFTLEKRGEEQLGLRFDITVPVVRMFVAEQKKIAKPVKWFYITRMWRYEAPQKGRLREFYQFGVEILGSDKPEADAEAIAVAIDGLLALGLTQKDFVVKINNRKLLQGLLYGLGIKKEIEAVIRTIDKYRKLSEKEFDLELNVLKLDDRQIKGIKRIMGIRNLEELKDFELNDEAQQGLDELKAVLDVLKSYGKSDFIEVDLSIARGLAYYTGTVYECYEKKGKMFEGGLRSIFAGGRYDNLVEQFGGEECPATGFAMGDVVLELILREKDLWPKPDLGPDYYIAPVSENERKAAIDVAQKLRKKYRVEIDLMGRKLGKQMEYADNIKAKKVIIIGEEELKEGKIKIKDMKSGKETKVSIDSL